ncbi:procathepsin L [Neodiprion virginianus]|uniref:procathepsin L n=1 Tax=Neodiprion virginianus TaxID=2961670 RepID=UPI001EE75C90|nr:procathepsin L [Neodiprion virginianus]
MRIMKLSNCGLFFIVSIVFSIAKTGNGTGLPKEVSEKLDDYWEKYKLSYKKNYSTTKEAMRRLAWEENLIKIYEHNLLAAAGHHSYTLRDNHFADLSTPEYILKMVKLVRSRRRRLSENDELVNSIRQSGRQIPPSLDWREKGFETAAENQEDCGSCYAYSVVTSIQGQIFKETGMLIPLSTQQIIDCSTSVGNLGCSGGSLRNTMRYLEKAKGLMPEKNYPYTAQQGYCKFVRDDSVVNITAWAILPARDEHAMEYAVATIGPIAASINASPKTFQLYHRGVYDDPGCSSDVVNHAMLLVGYTPTYWILKNWWGDNWGDNGYMKLARHKNRCGVANYAAYAKV